MLLIAHIYDCVLDLYGYQSSDTHYTHLSNVLRPYSIN